MAVRRLSLVLARAGGLLTLVLTLSSGSGRAAEEAERLGPTAWGDDHVGKPIPEYITGDECLFCHRDIGPTWPKNRHQLTIRRPEPDASALRALQSKVNQKMAQQVQFLLGGERQVRFLRRSTAYGKLDLLTAAFQPDGQSGGKLTAVDPHWDGHTFADKCAGCHATAVDEKTKAFSATGIDCYSCHGSVSLEHTKDKSRVFLAAKNRGPREVISTCGQCHLRGGTSRTTQLPYANHFVPGDNLFRDFAVDLSDQALRGKNPAERHIFENSRDVVVFGKQDTTCLTCHDVHLQSSDKHQTLEDSAICQACHIPGGAKSVVRKFQRGSKTCDY